MEIWEVTTRQLVAGWPLDLYSSSHDTSITWSPDSTRIASNLSGFVLWSPDGKYIASGNEAEIRHAMTGELLVRYKSSSHRSAAIQVWEAQTGVHSAQVVLDAPAANHSSVSSSRTSFHRARTA